MNPTAEYARLARMGALSQVWDALNKAEAKAAETHTKLNWRQVIRTIQMRDDAQEGTK